VLKAGSSAVYLLEAAAAAATPEPIEEDTWSSLLLRAQVNLAPKHTITQRAQVKRTSCMRAQQKNSPSWDGCTIAAAVKNTHTHEHREKKCASPFQRRAGSENAFEMTPPRLKTQLIGNAAHVNYYCVRRDAAKEFE